MIPIFVVAILLQSPEPIHVSVNNGISQRLRTVLITQEDSVQLSTPKSGYWISLHPTLREYDNLSNGAKTIQKIEYKTKVLSRYPSNQLNLKLLPGTYHIGFCQSQIDTTFSTFYPLINEYSRVVQIVVREDNSYLGYLTELIGLPFVIPPKRIGTHGHQTDLRLGTDCAELAIYGRRRMGYGVPYCGPRRMLEYLERSDELKPGTIVHFGYQVSVLYKDRGRIGVLDSDDLLIHAYQDKVAIEAFGNTDMTRKQYKLYTWKRSKK